MTSSRPESSLFDIKILLLVVSVLLMFAVVGLSVAGMLWSAEKGQPMGAYVVLGISGLAAAAGIVRLWTTRKDHLG